MYPFSFSPESSSGLKPPMAAKCSLCRCCEPFRTMRPPSSGPFDARLAMPWYNSKVSGLRGFWSISGAQSQLHLLVTLAQQRFLRGHASTGLISVLPVLSLTGCEILIPSNEAIKSLSPHAWPKVSRIFGCLNGALAKSLLGPRLDRSRTRARTTHDLIFQTKAS